MSATLQLIPITHEECCSRLHRACITWHDIVDINADIDNVCSHRIIFKTCKQSDDIVDVDALDDYTLETQVGLTVYTKQRTDGSISATVSLGRNMTTGIRKPFLSRALCDISFSCENNKQEQTTAAAFLTMCKPPGADKYQVHIDGKLVDKPINEKVPLKHGCIISLFGPTGFAFEVSISNNDRISW